MHSILATILPDWLTALVSVLAQTEIIPDGIPAWVWLAATAVAAWFARDAWPFLKSTWSADAKARREALLLDAKEDEERYLRAFETSSQAQATTATALDKIATALDMFARNSVAMTFELTELRRLLRQEPNPAREPDADAQIVARLLRQEPKP